MVSDHRELFIEKVVNNRSFLEVGGLWGEVNEKATVAHRHGASSISALDIWEEDNEWWQKFTIRSKEHGIKYYSKFVGSIDNSDIVKSIPLHQVVHCSGVLYHCPNPFLTISNLASVCSEYLILTSATFPNLIKSQTGGMYLDDDCAISVPALSPQKRVILNDYILDNYGGGAYGINSPVDTWYYSDSNPNYGPWWWIWTPNYLKAMVQAVGFKIIDEGSQFNGTGHSLLLKKNTSDISNFSVY